METEQKVQSGMGGFDTNALLDRHSPIYDEIVACQTSYELRYFIAYEAAIRNVDVQKALASCILNHDCTQVKTIYGFSDDAILYYRLTHVDLFPPQNEEKKGIAKQGLSSLKQAEHTYTKKPYSIKTVKENSIILNETPIVVNEDNRISPASLSDYKEFKELILEGNFRRPKLQPIKKKDFYVELNFELPESEIIEYIGELYKLYHKESIKGTVELLSESDDFLHSKQTKANSRKFADMFYVYDCFVAYRERFDTENELHEKISLDLRYADKDDEASPLASTTIRNYQVRMVQLVEELGYLELLTGIKH